MKKQKLVGALFASLLIVACNKKNDDVVTADANDVQKETANLPNDAGKAAGISWDQLPAELKNAPDLSQESQKTAQQFLPPCSVSGTVTPAWGGFGGSAFAFKPLSCYRIQAIGLGTGNVINRLIVWYRKPNGQILVGVNKGVGNFQVHSVYPLKINKVAGSTTNVVTRLRFYRTDKTSFVAGAGGGTPFVYKAPAPQHILGFYGKSGFVINRIGFYRYNP